jgi:hypothetical protein
MRGDCAVSPQPVIDGSPEGTSPAREATADGNLIARRANAIAARALAH